MWCGVPKALLPNGYGRDALHTGNAKREGCVETRAVCSVLRTCCRLLSASPGLGGCCPGLPWGRPATLPDGATEVLIQVLLLSLLRFLLLLLLLLLLWLWLMLFRMMWTQRSGPLGLGLGGPVEAGWLLCRTNRCPVPCLLCRLLVDRGHACGSYGGRMSVWNAQHKFSWCPAQMVIETTFMCCVRSVTGVRVHKCVTLCRCLCSCAQCMRRAPPPPGPASHNACGPPSPRRPLRLGHQPPTPHPTPKLTVGCRPPGVSPNEKTWGGGSKRGRGGGEGGRVGVLGPAGPAPRCPSHNGSYNQKDSGHACPTFAELRPWLRRTSAEAPTAPRHTRMCCVTRGCAASLGHTSTAAVPRPAASPHTSQPNTTCAEAHGGRQASRTGADGEGEPGLLLSGGGGGEGGWGFWTQNLVYQKWPDQIFPMVNLTFSRDGHFGLGRGGGGFGGGVPPPPLGF